MNYSYSYCNHNYDFVIRQLTSIFSLLLCTTKHNSQIITITNVTPSSTSYKAYSNRDGMCKFDYFYILINGSNSYSYTISGANAYFNYPNDISMLVQLDLLNVEIGTRTVIFDNTITFQVECIEFDYSMVSFKRVDYFTRLYGQTNSFTYNIIYELVGNGITLDYNALNTLPFSSGCNGLFCVLTYDKHRYFHLQIFNTPGIENFIDKPFIINVDNHQFTLDPFLTSQFDEVYDITTYPPPYLLSNFTSYGYGVTAVVQFKSNNSMLHTRSYITKFATSYQFQYYPIYGNEISTTYLLALPVYNQPLTCDLYYQNGSSFVQAPQITGYINSYNIDSLSLLWTFTLSSQDQNQLLDFKFILNKQSYINRVRTGVHGVYTNFKFPYGFVRRIGSTSLEYKVTTLVKSTSSEINSIYLSAPNEVSSSKTYISPGGNYSGINVPKVSNVEKFHLFGDRWLLKIHVTLALPFSKIVIYPQIVFGIETKVGSSDIYEIVVQSSYSDYFTLYDMYDGSVTYIDNTPFVGSGLGSFYNAPGLLKLNNFDVYSIESVSFLYNNLNVTNRRHYNVLYFNYTDIPRDTSITMDVLDSSIYQNLVQDLVLKFNNETFYAVYDYSLQLFKIEFYVDPNTQYGEFQFKLTIGGIYYLYHSSISEKLIISSTNMDLYGPIITGYTSSSAGLINLSTPNGTSMFEFTIEDKINGFNWGYTVIRGSIDQSIYNFTFTANDVREGDLYSGSYRFYINVTYPCITQELAVTEIVLYDRMKRISVYDTYMDNPNYSGVINPLKQFDKNIRTSQTCTRNPDNSIASDSTPPVLVSFIASTYSIDSSLPQTIDFTLEAQDLESGLKRGQNPIIYLSTTYNNVLQCKTNNIEFTGTEDKPTQNGKYSCSIEIPIGFGNNFGIILSVYGFINNNGLYSGFSSSDLINNGHGYYISSSYQNSNSLLFTGHHRISERGGDLYIKGRNLNSLSTSSEIIIEYENGTKQIATPDNIHFTILRIKGIPPTRNKFKIYTPTSNTLIVTPTVFNYYLNPNEEPSSSSSSSSNESSSTTTSSSNEPLPTNSPQPCPGNPVCGGPSNGKCIENQGCICYSPWLGLDCKSQIIIIDQPTTNDTSPSTNITLPVNNNNNNSSTIVTYKSLISLISIREVDVFGKVVYSKSFEKWQVKELDSTTFIYNTTLEIEKNNNKISTIEFKVTLKWFINETTITFANEQLSMNPSTMKYTVEINSYPFDSNLNQLQVVMLASLQSNTTDNICSLREYGETTAGDNSNYLKIQVDDHSLFGRFIRRGIIDSTIRSITNILLDKDMNPITTTKELQSYIAIQVPNYEKSVMLDPDFSVIVDSYSASSKSNSICSNNSKLTSGKIAGIVVGCVAFAAVVVTAVTYHLVKKKKKSNFISNMNKKMKQMN